MVKHPYKVHAWGAFCAQGPIALVLFTENLNAKRYQEILETYFFPYVSVANRRLHFQQDNSPIHKADKITELFERHHIRILDWLPTHQM